VSGDPDTPTLSRTRLTALGAAPPLAAVGRYPTPRALDSAPVQ
jgi:hypothetical protein